MKLLFLLLLFMAPAVVYGATAPETGSPFAEGLRLFGGLVLIIGLILLLYAASQRWLRWLPTAKTGLIRVVEMRSLGPKKSLCLVEVRGRELLLGVAADRIELLCQLDGEPRERFAETLERELEGSL